MFVRCVIVWLNVLTIIVFASVATLETEIIVKSQQIGVIPIPALIRERALNDRTAVTTVNVSQDIVVFIAKIFVNHVCYGHALMEENVSQRVRNVSVFANRLTFNLTVMRPLLIDVFQILAKMVVRVGLCQRKMTTFATASVNSLERIAQIATALRPNHDQMGKK